MNSLRGLGVALLTVLSSCDIGNVSNIPDNSGASGFGYASGLFRNDAGIYFDVTYDREGTVQVAVRCRCSYEYDADACVLDTESGTYPIVIPETGKWCLVPVEIVVGRGPGRIVVRKVHPMKGDVQIDYIEFL